MTLTSSLKAQIQATLVGSGDLGTPQAGLNLLESLNFASGTTNVQADKIFADTRTISGSGSETLDMGTTGGLLDPLGAAFEPAEVVAILIVAPTANAHAITVGAAAAEPFLGPMGGTAPTETIKAAGGHLFWYSAAGWAVTNNTNDKLKLANGGAADVTYSIIILARSA